MNKRNSAKQIDHTQCLCEQHAHAFGLDAGQYIKVPAAHEQGADEPIQCERCSFYLMRSAGVL